MAQFKTIQEVVLRNSFDCELDRVELQVRAAVGEFLVPSEVHGWFRNLCVGDTITIEERETEIE